MTRLLLWAAAGLLLTVLVVRTRGAILALLPVALPLLLPMLRDWLRRRPPAGGPAQGQSSVETRFLRMRLDHASGELHGQVIAGQFTGRGLAELSRGQLLNLWQECAADPQSSAVLETYLDQVWPEWRDAHAAPPPGAPLDDAEAYAVLGLRAGAGRDEIIAAHRRLMQRVHPDHGGSDYLAERINAAKTQLLKSTGSG